MNPSRTRLTRPTLPPKGWRTFACGAALILSISVFGCKSDKDQPDTAPSAAVSNRAAPAPLPYPSASVWSAAKGQDALLLQALAEAEGATNLLRYVQSPGPAQDQALKAIVFAPDAEVALGDLAQAAATEDDAVRRLALLETIAEIAGRAQTPTEQLDPEGMRACAGTMLMLAGRSDLTAEERAMAKTAGRRLARKGFIDPSRLDP